jgi:hypothetical protein
LVSGDSLGSSWDDDGEHRVRCVTVESDPAGPCSRDQGEHLQADECNNEVGRILRASGVVDQRILEQFLDPPESAADVLTRQPPCCTVEKSVSPLEALRAKVCPFSLPAEETGEFDGLRARSAEPVRNAGVEFGRLARCEHQILLTEKEAQPSVENVQRFVALVCLRIGAVSAG